METRERLLARALKLFAARGYEAVGVQEIVEAAGVTKPSLYHHFGSKDGLLKALLEDSFQEFFDALGPALGYHRDLNATLVAVAQAYLGFAQRRPDFYRLQLALWYAAPESAAHQAVAPYVGRQRDLLEQLFKSVVPDHGNLRGHHATYAVVFPGLLNAVIAAPERARLEAKGDALARHVVKQFMHGIYAL
jgi:TetR/AcrR family transcriptional regulator